MRKLAFGLGTMLLLISSTIHAQQTTTTTTTTTAPIVPMYSAGPVYAGPEYGIAGCGLGSVFFGRQNTLGSQILASTSNHTGIRNIRHNLRDIQLHHWRCHQGGA